MRSEAPCPGLQGQRWAGFGSVQKEGAAERRELRVPRAAAASCRPLCRQRPAVPRGDGGAMAERWRSGGRCSGCSVSGLRCGKRARPGLRASLLQPAAAECAGTEVKAYGE